MLDYAYDLGTYSPKITTSSPEAQVWFNHALKADPNCAMAYWGLAYIIGPNYNKPWKLFDGDEV